MITWLRRLAIALLSLVAACSSSNNDVCDNVTVQPPASEVWPSSRHDGYNTGRTATDLSANLGLQVWVFPLPGATPKGAFVSAPAISAAGSPPAEVNGINNGPRVYI